MTCIIIMDTYLDTYLNNLLCLITGTGYFV